MRDESADSENSPHDPSITPELFLRWRAPRFGRTNPERMDNPVWEWLIRSKLNAYSANELHQGPSSLDAGPTWCFDRFGQSSTMLPDGRELLIAGEHEDSYDADFYIYNDVVIRHLDGKLEILGYPSEIFPPTDFHTANLVGNQIILVGSLGHPKQRRLETTPITVLNIATLAISSPQTSGVPPGWIHRHEATLEEGGASLLIHGGKLCKAGGTLSPVENIDDWRLHLLEWRWERLTERQWQRWEFIRRDGKHNHIWELEQARWNRDVALTREQPELEKLTQQLGARPNLDLVHKLFSPPINHTECPRPAGEFNVFRIEVDGILVRYVYDTFSVQMTVEGLLPQAATEILVSDLLKKLETLENAPFNVTQF
jgi:hypothetical protein